MYCVLGRGPKFRLSSKRGQKSGSHVSVPSDDALYIALEQAYTEFTHRQYPRGRSPESENSVSYIPTTSISASLMICAILR